MTVLFSHILYVKEGIRIAPKDLRSTKSILDENILQLIQKYDHYFQKVLEIVEFIDNIRNPFGIYDFMREYANKNGIQHKKIVEFENKKTNEIFTQEIDDYYEPNNPEEYVMCIIDHIGLITSDSENGRKMSLHESILKLSADYLIRLRNKYNYIPIVVQQQAAAQESVENFKLNKLKPSLDGLGDNKLTGRDANVILGIFSPFRHEIPEYMGYNIKFFRDNIRFVEIIGGREGGAGTTTPLYFDGAVNYFKELPLPEEKEKLIEFEKYINKNLR